MEELDILEARLLAVRVADLETRCAALESRPVPVITAPVHARILEALGSGEHTAAELAHKLDKHRSEICRALLRLSEAGQVRNVGKRPSRSKPALLWGLTPAAAVAQ